MTNYHNDPNLPFGNAADPSDERDKFVALFNEMFELAHEIEKLDVTDNTAALTTKIRKAREIVMMQQQDRARLTAGMLTAFEQGTAAREELNALQDAAITGDINHPAIRALLEHLEPELESRALRKLVMDDMASTLKARPSILFGILAVLTGKEYNPDTAYEMAELMADVAEFLYESTIINRDDTTPPAEDAS